MGAGKTTIGKLLAKKLKKTFYDTDHEIEKKLGVKVAVIFERGLRTARKTEEEGDMADATLGPMVTNLARCRTCPRGSANNCLNCLTQIEEIAIMFGFVRRGSRAVKGIRL